MYLRQTGQFHGFLGSIRLAIYALKSVLYNDHLSWSYFFEGVFNPVLSRVEHVGQILGPILLLGAVILLSTVVAICYVFGVEWHLRYGLYERLTIAWCIGHYIMLVAAYHFYKGAVTNPGVLTASTAKKFAVDPMNSDVCRRCLIPKPPRAHHCSICNKCILRMDHHCPWLNNCVGLHTHRHFFLFALFLLWGCHYICMFGVPVLYDHIYTDKTEDYFEHVSETYLGKWVATKPYRVVIWIVSCLVSMVCCCTFGLLCWHIKLVLNNETSIEQLINAKERKRYANMGLVYKNPYDRGYIRNLKEVLLYPGQKSLLNIYSPFFNVDFIEGAIRMMLKKIRRRKRRAHHPRKVV